MRDQVSWAFTSVISPSWWGSRPPPSSLIIPAYIYDWKPIKEVAILGEILAISALTMCMGFVFVDIGRPDRCWHLIPMLGRLNFPSSLLAWDVIVLNGYFLLNIVIVGYLLYCSYEKKHYNKNFVVPLILLSIPVAIGIHTVTAFIYIVWPGGRSGMPRFWRPDFWPARCARSGCVADSLSAAQTGDPPGHQGRSLWKIAEIMAYAMFINLFLLRRRSL